MRAFLVKLPSLVRYWTVVDDGYRVVRVADEYLQHLRLGQDAAESTTKAYAEALALYLRWCEQTSRDWRTAVERLGGFITWSKHTSSDPDVLVAGPGIRDVRGPGRINRILSVVRRFIRHAVVIGEVPGGVLAALYDISDGRHLPVEVRGEASGLRYVARPRHRRHVGTVQDAQDGFHQPRGRSIHDKLGDKDRSQVGMGVHDPPVFTGRVTQPLLPADRPGVLDGHLARTCSTIAASTWLRRR
jgi:hypothetical protein